ncbi:hypothetical protein [Escherichia phage UPEC06]|nr:hypothetical protein [Escherichia phage UPEC06]
MKIILKMLLTVTTKSVECITSGRGNISRQLVSRKKTK